MNNNQAIAYAVIAMEQLGYTIEQMRMRMEGVFILLIFTATALLGQQEPPHSIKDTLKTSGAGLLSEITFPSLGFAYSDVQFEPTVTSIILVTISLLFGGLLVFVIRTTHDFIKIFYLGLGVSVSLFFAALYSISVFL